MGPQSASSTVALLALCSTYLVISSKVSAFHLAFGNRLFRSIQQSQDNENQAQLYHPVNLNPASSLIRPIECRNANNHSEAGICMFSIDCMQNKGTPLSICKHNYFVGTCCRLPNYNNFVGIVYDLRDTENQNMQLEARKVINQATGVVASEQTSNGSQAGPRQPDYAPVVLTSAHGPPATLSNLSEAPSHSQPAGVEAPSTRKAETPQQQATTSMVPETTASKFIISSTSLFATSPSLYASSSTYQHLSSHAQTFQTGSPPHQQEATPSVTTTTTTTNLPSESPRNADGVLVPGRDQVASLQDTSMAGVKPSIGELVDSFHIQRDSSHPTAPPGSNVRFQPAYQTSPVLAIEQTMIPAQEVISSAHSAPSSGLVVASVMNSTDKRQQSHHDFIYQLATTSPGSSLEISTGPDANGSEKASTDAQNHIADGFTLTSPAQTPSPSGSYSPSTPTIPKESVSPTVAISSSASQEFAPVSSSTPLPAPRPSQAQADAASLSTTSDARTFASSNSSGPVDLVSSTSEQQLQTTTPFTGSLSTASLPSVHSRPYSPTQAPPQKAANQVLVSSSSSPFSVAPETLTTNQEASSARQPSETSSSETLAGFSQLYSSQHSAAATSTTVPIGQRLPSISSSRQPLIPANGQYHYQHLGSGLPMLQATSKIVAGSTSNHLIPGLGGLQSAILAHIPFKLANGLSSGLSSYLQAAMKPTGTRPLLSSNTATALQYQHQQAGNSSAASNASRNPTQSSSSGPSGPNSGIRFPTGSGLLGAFLETSGSHASISSTTTTTTTTTTQAPLQARDVIREAQLVCGRPQVSQAAPLPLEAGNLSTTGSGGSASTIKRRIGRIVGGNQSWFGQWPWMVSLRQWRKGAFLHKCGAALLNENWAITAAHCVENVKASDLLLRLGEFDVSKQDEPYPFVERRVRSVISHPSFDPKTFEYDLALLRFTEPIQYERNIIPVCVPDGNDTYVDRMATVIGWGRLYEDGPLPDVIQHVDVPIITNNECEKMYKNAGYIEEIPDMFICAGINKGGRDSCEGDSGGPLTMVDHDGRSYLVGIISWGIGCALPSQPGVYTRITAFSNWINDQMLLTTSS